MGFSGLLADYFARACSIVLNIWRVDTICKIWLDIFEHILNKFIKKSTNRLKIYKNYSANQSELLPYKHIKQLYYDQPQVIEC